MSNVQHKNVARKKVATDRRILRKAAREKKPVTTGIHRVVASVLKEESAALGGAIAEMIDSRSKSEFGPEAFIKALQTIRSVQLELEGQAAELDGAAARGAI